MRTAIIALAALLCGGCATEGMSIPIGEAHNFAPTNAESIAILLTAPDQPHEVIALVEGVAATDDYWGSETRTQQAALDAMKQEAARLGTHAIVLTAKGSEPYGQVAVSNGYGSASAYGVGNSAFGSGHYSSTTTTMGYQKIRVQGTAVRYVSED